MPDAPIPSELRTVLEVRDALIQYMSWWKPSGPRISRFQSLDSPSSPRRKIETPFNRAAGVLAQLQRHTGPGPCVRAQPDSSTGYLVGRISAAGREVIALRLPDGPLDTYTADPISVLAEVTAGAGIVHALMTRCQEIVAADRGGRTRQTSQFTGEAAGLATFGDEMSSTVIDLGDLFLEQWNAEAARRGGSTPAAPAVKAISLR